MRGIQYALVLLLPASLVAVTSIIDKREEPRPAPEGVQAPADDQAPERSAMLDAYGWGPEENGLRLGLLHKWGQREFSYGDALTLVFRARNTGDKPLALRFEPRYADEMRPVASVSADNRLDLNTQDYDPVLLRLEPGEEQAVPDLELRTRLCAPGDLDRYPSLYEPGECVALLPGSYTLRFAHRMWIEDATDPIPHTTHRAVAGFARFTLRDDPANPWVVERIVYDQAGSPGLRREMPGQPAGPVQEVAAPPELVCPDLPSQASGVAADRPIAWGDCVNGLQAALRLEATPGLHTPQDTETTAGRFAFGFYIRNCTNRQAKVALFDLAGVTWDWRPAITGSQGNSVDVRPPPSRIPLVRPADNIELAPGQCLRTNSLQLQLADHDLVLPDGPEWTSDWGLAPRALVEPGHYTVSCTPAASWGAGGCGEILLPTGGVAVDVTAGDLGREG